MTALEQLGLCDSRATQLHCLLYWAQRQPNKIYMNQPIEGGFIDRFTWYEVADQVLRMAAYLQSLDLPPRSQIAIYGKNSAHWIMADLAIWMAGHVSVPLYSTLNVDNAWHVLIHSEAKLLFIGKLDGQSDSWYQVREVIPENLPCIRLPLSPEYQGAPQWDDLIRSVSPLEEVVLPDPTELASIIYTSGSTGLPKGIMHSFASMMAPGAALNSFFSFNTEDRLLSHLPLAHVAERIFIEASSLYYGSNLYFVGSKESFLDDIHRARPTIFLAVPRLWIKFYLDILKRVPLIAQSFIFKLPKIDQFAKNTILTELGLDQVRVAFTASAPMPAHIIAWYRSLGLELNEAYGMTENFGYSHGTRSYEPLGLDVGQPYPGVECRIDTTGEILVKSPAMMLGYFKNQKLTAESITSDGFLRTGDKGVQDAQGRLTITGRVKDIFKTSKGKYVAPLPIERRLGRHTLISAVCVCGAGLTQPIALVMLSNSDPNSLKASDRQKIEIDLKALLKQTNAELESHETLDCLVVINNPWTVKNGFLTPTLKIKRHVIEANYVDQLDAWSQLNQLVVWE
ncbi:MAG: AMP-binding protein [Candidatus Saccharibacteria bacterium]|nr:AMP-binding protein [Moraxellaceae bacterium]